MRACWILLASFATVAPGGLTGCLSGGATSAALSPDPGGVPVGAPLFVTADLSLAPGRYVRPADDLEGVLVIEGLHGATLDLRGVELRASEDERAPDAARGRAVVLRDSSEVRVIGGRATGYAVGFLVERCRDVVLDGVEVSGFRAQRLRGTSAAPDPADQLDLDAPRAEDWLRRYGAAIAVVDSSRVTVRGARARGGQNGLLVARSEGVQAHDCDFSFLSGWGVCLARASRCVVARNRLEACARGYSAGRYADPQGAAGILVAGASEGNVIAHNRATACGNGALVHAPPPDPAVELEPNLWYANDFSHAVGASFRQGGGQGSRLVANRMSESLGGGVDARATSGLVLYKNTIEGAVGAGVSIVDGRDCLLVANTVTGCDRGVELASSDRGAGGARSGGHWLVDNRLADNVQDLVLESSRELVFGDNRYSSSAPSTHFEELLAADGSGARDQEAWALLRGPDGSLPSGRAWGSSLRRPPPEGHPGVAALARFEPPVLPVEGPPRAAARQAGSGLERLVLGPFGPWDPESGSPRPAVRAPGGLLEGLSWDAVWFRWDAESDPRGDLDHWRARRFEPAARGRVAGWADPWGGPERRRQVGEECFGLIASAELALARGGVYVLDVISDDGVRITVDGRTVLEDWTWHAERRDTVEIELEAGRHQLGLEYFQLGGAAALTVALDRRVEP